MADKYDWSRREDEPTDLYYAFSRYYLVLGPNRSFLKAYKAWLAIEDPDYLRDKGAPSKCPDSWSEAAEKFDWLERAAAYDEKMFTDDGIVEVARQMLRNSTLDAAAALHRALNNPRQSVAAAKEILDRSGILAAQVQINKELPFTADEMAEATKEIEEWEKNAKNG